MAQLAVTAQKNSQDINFIVSSVLLNTNKSVSREKWQKINKISLHKTDLHCVKINSIFIYSSKTAICHSLIHEILIAVQYND